MQSDSVEVNTQEIAIERGKETSGQLSQNKKDQEFSESILSKAMEQANKALNDSNRQIERHIHEKTKVIMFKIVDKETKEVIKEFPPEKIQDMIAKMWELAGLFVDEKA